MKIKIIAIIAVIATISALFCISTMAVEFEPYVVDTEFSVTFPSSTRFATEDYGRYYFNFQYQSGNYDSVKVDGNTSIWFYVGVSSRQNLTSNGALSITIKSGQTLSTSAVTFLDKYTTWEAPIPPPPPMETVMDNVNGVWNTTLTVATLIITWLVANQIALCGLYLYILIAVIGICKRFVNAK